MGWYKRRQREGKKKNYGFFARTPDQDKAGKIGGLRKRRKKKKCVSAMSRWGPVNSSDCETPREVDILLFSVDGY